MEGNCWLVIRSLCPLGVTLYVMRVRELAAATEAHDAQSFERLMRGLNFSPEAITSLPFLLLFPVSGRVLFSLPLHVLYSLPHPTSLTEQEVRNKVSSTYV